MTIAIFTYSSCNRTLCSDGGPPVGCQRWYSRSYSSTVARGGDRRLPIGATGKYARHWGARHWLESPVVDEAFQHCRCIDRRAAGSKVARVFESGEREIAVVRDAVPCHLLVDDLS